MAQQLRASSSSIDLISACSARDFPGAQQLFRSLTKSQSNELSTQFSALDKGIRTDLLEQSTHDKEAEMIRYILQTGPDLEIPEAAVRWALLVDTPEPYQVLFSFDPAIINMTIYDGRETQIGKALSVSTTPARLEALLATGLRPSNDPYDMSPLCLACGRWQSESETLCEILLRHGALLKHSGALAAAARCGRLELVRWLLERGAEVNDIVTQPAMMEEPWRGNPWPPLHSAIERGHEDVVRLLLAKGADPSLLDGEGQTAYDVAEKAGIGSLLPKSGHECTRRDE